MAAIYWRQKCKSIEGAKEYIGNKFFPQLIKLGYSNYTVIKKNEGLKIGISDYMKELIRKELTLVLLFYRNMKCSIMVLNVLLY